MKNERSSIENLIENGQPLDPLAGGAEYEATVEIVRQFVDRVGFFTEPDLHNYASGQNITLPNIRSKSWKETYSSIQQSLITRYEKDGQKKIWVKTVVDDQLMIGLAEVYSGEQPDTEASSSPEEESTQEGEPSPLITLLDSIIDAELQPNPDQPIKKRQIIDKLPPELSDTEGQENLGLLLENQLSLRGIVKVTQKGSVTFRRSDLIDPESEESDKISSANREASKLERVFTEDELKLVSGILDYLTRVGTHASQGDTLKTLHQKFAKDMSKRDFHKVIRAVESGAQYIRISKSAGYGKTRKSPRVTVRNQDIKKLWLEDRETCLGVLGKTKFVA